MYNYQIMYLVTNHQIIFYWLEYFIEIGIVQLSHIGLKKILEVMGKVKAGFLVQAKLILAV